MPGMWKVAWFECSTILSKAKLEKHKGTDFYVWHCWDENLFNQIILVEKMVCGRGQLRNECVAEKQVEESACISLPVMLLTSIPALPFSDIKWLSVFFFSILFDCLRTQPRWRVEREAESRAEKPTGRHWATPVRHESRITTTTLRSY